MLRSERLIFDRESSLDEMFGLGIHCALMQIHSCLSEHFGSLRKIKAIFIDQPGQRLYVLNQTTTRSPGVILDIRENSTCRTDCAFCPDPAGIDLHLVFEDILNQSMNIHCSRFGVMMQQ